MTVRVDTDALLTWINGDPAREQLLIDEAPISPSTLANLKNGYQPHRNRAKRINEVMQKYPLDVPKSNRKVAVG